MVPEVALAAAVHVGEAAPSFHELHGAIPLPWENHRLFGAGFLFIGVLLLVEALAGGVWFRQGWRRDIWPAVLTMFGWGLLFVAVVDPNDRVIHSLMGLMLIVAGIAERRYRHGQMPLLRANLFVAAALVFAGIEVGVFHSHGALTSEGFIVHAVLGITAALLAPARFWYALRPTSMWRSALVGLLVLILALELLGLSHGDNIDIHASGTFSG